MRKTVQCQEDCYCRAMKKKVLRLNKSWDMQERVHSFWLLLGTLNISSGMDVHGNCNKVLFCTFVFDFLFSCHHS